MNRKNLFDFIVKQSSYLSVGLDTDLDRIPKHLLGLPDPVFEFNKQIIDATQDLCVAYKPNLAFYEALGAKGIESLQKTLDYMPKTHLSIADAKRGDIGNTSRLYAKAFFETYGFDALTIAPYMGEDSVRPFLAFENKWVIVLALTSNKGYADFQLMEENQEALYARVMRKCQEWASPDQLMFVTGATHPEFFKTLRNLAPDSFFLVPGIGAQGGDLEAVSKAGMNDHCGLIVNSSRGIIYAGSEKDFADKARDAAKVVQEQMAQLLNDIPTKS